MLQIFVGRQPILNAASELFAYELLCRDGTQNAASFESADQASASVVLNAFVDIGLANVVGRHLAFIRLTERLLFDELYRILPADHVILSLPDNAAPDGPMLQAVRTAVDLGYKIALCGFAAEHDFMPFVELARYAKVNTQALSRERVLEVLGSLAPAGVTVVADRVETREQFEFLKEAGYRYFKGYYFFEPEVLQGKAVPADRLTVLELLSRIRDPNVPMEQVREIVERDVSLSYRILRCANSSLYAFPRRIESIRHSIALLGLDRVRDCLTLSLLAEFDNKPQELSIIALVRARTCQLLARAVKVQREDVFFSAGLLSVLDAILDCPMTQIVTSMGLSSELCEALVEGKGPAGEALRAAQCCERETADLNAIRRFGPQAIRESYLEAIRWVEELNEALLDPPKPRHAR